MFLDVTEMIDYSVDLLNHHDLANSFFYLDRHDPTVGFAFDATQLQGPTYPDSQSESACPAPSDPLPTRLRVASHLAGYLRLHLEHQMGYTSSVGISTSKLLSKVVGSTHKPCNQTTLLPPYESNVVQFLDALEIRKIPGIGFKLAHKLRAHALGLSPDPNADSHSTSPDTKVPVRDIRLLPGMGPIMLGEILGGPGAPKDIGMRVWSLIHGVDNSPVMEARDIPTQISIEDSFPGLEGQENVKKALVLLAASLIRRMRVDLTDSEDSLPPGNSLHRAWIAHPRTLRLSTRFRSPEEARARGFSRTSRTAPLPQFIFSLDESVDALAERLFQEALIAMFRKLQPHRSGWSLSLLNVAVTNMVEIAGERKRSGGRDIEKMFRTQETVLRDWKVPELDHAPSLSPQQTPLAGTESWNPPVCDSQEHAWEDSDEEDVMPGVTCMVCGASIPYFAEAAHKRFHLIAD